MNSKELLDDLRGKVALLLDRSREQVNPSENLVDQGLDSYGFMELVTELEERLKMRFSEDDLISEKLQTLDGMVSLVLQRVTA